jgi:cell division septal protein FtsQ
MKQHARIKRQESFWQRGFSWLPLIPGRKSNGEVWTSRHEAAMPPLRREVDRGWSPARLLSLLLLITSGWLFYWFSTNEMFYVRSVQVEGSERVQEAELLSISDLDGINIFWVDTRAAEMAIEELPDIASARVRCGLPADCTLHLVERQPLFVWLQGDARAWIGADGTVLPARGDFDEAIVLDAGTSTALKPGDQVDLELVTAVEQLHKLNPEIRTYQFSKEYGLTYRNVHGWMVRLGLEPPMEAKLGVLEVLTEHLVSQGITPSFVDVRYPEAPFYRE